MWAGGSFKFGISGRAAHVRSVGRCLRSYGLAKTASAKAAWCPLNSRNRIAVSRLNARWNRSASSTSLEVWASVRRLLVSMVAPFWSTLACTQGDALCGIKHRSVIVPADARNLECFSCSGGHQQVFIVRAFAVLQHCFIILQGGALRGEPGGDIGILQRNRTTVMASGRDFGGRIGSDSRK